MTQQEFFTMILAPDFHPANLYAFQENESNDARQVRIDEYENHLNAASLLSPEELSLYNGGTLGCRIGCLLPDAQCRRQCGYRYPCCAICDVQLADCLKECTGGGV